MRWKILSMVMTMQLVWGASSIAVGADIKSVADGIIVNTKSILKKLKFETGDINPTVSFFEESWIEGNRVEISYGANCEFTYDIESNRILEFVDFSRGMKARTGLVTQKEAQAKWTSQMAVSEAKKFIQTLGVESGTLTGGGTAKWVAFKQRGDAYTRPYWQVYWQRLTAEGIPFLDDTYTVHLSEDLGPFFYKSTMVTVFEESINLDEISKRQEAVLSASKHVAPTINNPAFAALIPAGKLSINSEPVETQLQIVRPNYFKRLTNAAKIVQVREGRLAWVVCFDCILEINDKITMQKEVAPAVSVYVWLDAKDGTYLGGDLISY